VESDLALMELQVEALFIHDDRGRLRCVNEPGEPAAPRFFLGRTGAGNLWRFGHALPEELVQRLEELLSAEPVSPDLIESPVCLSALRSALAAHAPIRGEFAGPAYQFPGEIRGTETVIGGRVLAITEQNAELLRDNFADVIPELAFRQPCFVVVHGGTAVSMCFSARLTARAAEAGVGTLEAFRGHGYASAVTAAWALAVRAGGRRPLYSTSWDNLASQGVARRLGLSSYGADLWIS